MKRFSFQIGTGFRAAPTIPQRRETASVQPRDAAAEAERRRAAGRPFGKRRVARTDTTFLRVTELLGGASA